MSWATCYSGSNNVYFNNPPIMADGRNYASWQPESVINNRIIAAENIKNNFEYRQYLQNNSVHIMKYDNTEYCNSLGLPCHYNSDKTPSSMYPYKYKSVFDTNKPGFGYCDSNLKNPYLSREQLNARMFTSTINPNNFN